MLLFNLLVLPITLTKLYRANVSLNVAEAGSTYSHILPYKTFKVTIESFKCMKATESLPPFLFLSTLSPPPPPALLSTLFLPLSLSPFPGMSKQLMAADLPSRLVLDSVLCLLRSLVIGVGVHSHQLNSRTTHSVASLLCHIVQCGTVRGRASCAT